MWPYPNEVNNLTACIELNRTNKFSKRTPFTAILWSSQLRAIFDSLCSLQFLYSAFFCAVYQLVVSFWSSLSRLWCVGANMDIQVLPYCECVHPLMWSDKAAKGMSGTTYTFSSRRGGVWGNTRDVCCYIKGICTHNMRPYESITIRAGYDVKERARREWLVGALTRCVVKSGSSYWTRHFNLCWQFI